MLCTAGVETRLAKSDADHEGDIGCFMVMWASRVCAKLIGACLPLPVAAGQGHAHYNYQLGTRHEASLAEVYAQTREGVQQGWKVIILTQLETS